jgi:hypothetical protein
MHSPVADLKHGGTRPAEPAKGFRGTKSKPVSSGGERGGGGGEGMGGEGGGHMMLRSPAPWGATTAAAAWNTSA